MKELIKIEKHETLINAVCARELHKKLEIGKDFSNWVKEQIERADLTQDVDFVKFAEKGEYKKPLTQYALTLDAAKNIAMLSQTQKGKEVRAYFIECEKKLIANKLPNFNDPAAAARAWASEYEAKQKTLEENAKLNTIIDNEFGYSSILRAATYAGVHEKTFNWRVLKKTTLGMNMKVKRVPSPRYGYMNLYPIRAFEIAYPDIDFDDLKPELVDDKAQLTIAKDS
ncbi:MAG: antA/AntB antirepressor family protein [Methylomicrobium sp.]|nr:antA/AntB antirepressor family protein [Methylomicrobium sp.]